MTGNWSRDLDNYITGHYGEDQFEDEPEPTVHPDILIDTAWLERDVRLLVHKTCFDKAPRGSYNKSDPARFEPYVGDLEPGDRCDFCAKALGGAS